MPTRSLHTTMPTGTDGNDFTAPDHLPLLGAMCPRCLCGWQPAAIRSHRLHQRPGNVGRVFGRALGGVGGVGGAPATARPPPSPNRLVRGGAVQGTPGRNRDNPEPGGSRRNQPISGTLRNYRASGTCPVCSKKPFKTHPFVSQIDDGTEEVNVATGSG